MMFEIEALAGRRYAELLTDPLLTAVGELTVETIEGRRYATRPERGFSLVLDDDDRISTVQLYRHGHQGFSRYAGATPGGLSFEMDRNAVRGRLGQPLESGEARTLPLLGTMPAWDAFRVEAHRLHVEYEPDGRGVRLISVSLADAAP
jgi:hypothetical protein